MMKDIWHSIQAGLALIGGWLGVFIGGVDGLIIALATFAVIDYLTGVACAIVDKRLSSEAGFKGIAKKVVMFMLVGVAHAIDLYVIKSGAVMRTAVIFFYLSNEGVSLLENAAHLGLPIPKKLKDVLAQLHKGGEDDK